MNEIKCEYCEHEAKSPLSTVCRTCAAEGNFVAKSKGTEPGRIADALERIAQAMETILSRELYR